ncbi:MAG TPA: hypothetical protein VF759_15600 [Allosphingosinicella sp.]|jgi:hypothetical protein
MFPAIALVALQAAAQPPSTTPQPGGMKSNSVEPQAVIVHTMPEPVVPGPPGRSFVYAIPEANEAPPDLLEFRVRSGNEILWEGRLRVAKPGASMIQHINETEPSGCPPSAYAHSVHSSLTTSVQRAKLSITPEGAFNYHVRVAWERPSSGRGCGNEGARRVEVSKGIDLRPEQSATLKGDVGLVVEVRRR